MRNIPLMQIHQSICHLLHYISALILAEFLMRLLLEPLREGYTRKVLHYYVEVVVGLYHVHYFYYIWVGYRLQDFYLSLYCPLAHRLLYF